MPNTTTTTIYCIESRNPHRGPDWDSYAVGDRSANRFSSRAAAEAAIEGLRALGDEWAEADYRVTVLERFTRQTAELYWDDQDPGCEGWWLRYYRTDGQEDGEALDGARDLGVEALAQIAAPILASVASDEDETMAVRIYLAGDDRPRALATVRGVNVVGWRAL